MRNSIENKHSIKTSYQYYKINTDRDKRVKRDDYYKICSEFCRFLKDKILEGNEVSFPGFIGTFYIRGRKQNYRIKEDRVRGMKVDWNKTYKYWNENPEAKKQKKPIYHTNAHSDSIVYRLHWDKHFRLRNKDYYRFTMPKHTRRELAQLIKGGKEYLVKETKDIKHYGD